jgi:hypothetical protein
MASAPRRAKQSVEQVKQHEPHAPPAPNVQKRAFIHLLAPRVLDATVKLALAFILAYLYMREFFY